MSGPDEVARRVVVLGTFDGVHLGHRHLLEHGRTHAGAGGIVVAATYDPHPRAVVAPPCPPLLCSHDERCDLLREAGADAVVTVPFTSALACLDPEEFVDAWLVGNLAADAVVVGADHRFGAGGAGDVEVLRDLAARRGFEVVAPALLQACGAAVSSSRIRELVEDGTVESAAALLGRPLRLVGAIRRGAQRGRLLGMPTANLAVDPSLVIPADGVYGGMAMLAGMRLLAATSIGTNPQFTERGRSRRTVEVHLVDHQGPEAYGEPLSVDFRVRIRGQERFNDVEALVERMQIDLDDIRSAARTW